ncbi:MFS transporter [Trueperella sp. LYQ141]|uniref:MFS transporter n=1 Tax=Trueperella sp. LYQ141 TaxID=3391058 RepID=UPI003982E500
MTHAASHTQHRPRTAHPGLILAAVATSSFLATFNETFLNVALTPIMREFSINEATVQWVTTAYMLVAAVAVPLTGFLYRKYPTRRLMLTSLGLLLAGSVIGIFTPSYPILILGRVIQAAGTGMIVPLGMNLTLAVAPPQKLGTYMGIVSAMTTLGPAFGPIAAGGILEFTSWHGLFVAFAIMICLVIALSMVAVTDIAELSNPTLDVISTVLASLGLIGTMYGASILFSGQALTGGIIFLLGIIILAAFILRQRTCAHPLLHLSPFRITGFNLGLLVVVIALMTVFSMNMILPVFMQSALGFSPLKAALTLLPACLVSCLLAPVAGKIFDKHGLRIMVPLGMIVIVACVFGLSRSSASTTSAMLIALYAPTIAGCALVLGPSQSFALSRLDTHQYPHGTTIVGTSFQLAGCFGSSLFMGVFSMAAQRSAASSSAAVAAANGFRVACMVACALTFVGLLLTFALARTESRGAQASHTQHPSHVVHISPEGNSGSASISAQPSASDELSTSIGLAPYSTAASVMETDVFYAPASATAYDVLALMVSHRTSGLPVLDDNGALVGFVTDGAILRALSSESQDKINMAYVFALWAQGKAMSDRVAELKEIPIMDLAFRRVISLDKDAPLQTVCETLSDRHVKKVPVTDGDRLVGVINRTELLRSMVSVA